jgi:hypothetical protein
VLVRVTGRSTVDELRLGANDLVGVGRVVGIRDGARDGAVTVGVGAT